MKKLLFVLAATVSSVVMAQTTTKNYIKSEAYQVPVQNQTEIDNLTDDNKIETITYYDELGRPIQSVAKQAGGNKQDIITPIVYDDLGRKAKQYLPYARNTSSLYYELPEDLLPAIANYYVTKFSDDLTIINPNVFSETSFETSPLNQTLKQGAPGQDWAIDPESNTDHTIKFDYLANTQDEVERFDVVFPTGNTEQPQPFYNGFYNAGELYKTITKDENWKPDPNNPNLDHTTEEFKDKQGRVVLKRTYNNNLAHDTHYIYDDFGNLTYVLSPKGSDNILTLNTYKKSFTQTVKATAFVDQDKYGNPNATGDATVSLDNINETLTINFNTTFSPASELINGPIILLGGFVPDIILGTISQSGANYIVSVQNNFLHISGSGTLAQITDSFTVNLPAYSPDPNVLNDLCYQYHYDYRNRLIEKKIPGKDWESIVYDKLDRPVLTQDALLKQNNEWLFTKYDALGRVVYTGKLLDIDNNRSEFQALLNLETVMHEAHTSGTSNVAGTLVNYTNQAFPTQNVIDVLTVNYYDSYTFDLAGLNMPSQNGYGHAISTNTKSLATGSKVRVLGTNNWITTITGYDDKARPVYVATKNNYLNTTDTVDSDLDFVGKVLQTTASHTKGANPAIVTIDNFTYDHTGRLLSQKQEIIGQAQERIVENYYDELGQLEKKDIGGETVFEGYTDVVGVEVNETTGIINKTAYTSWSNAGIATKGKFKGDGYVEFEAVQTNKHVFVGLSPININEVHSSVLYYIFLQDSGVVTVREDTNGDGTAEWVGSFGSYQIGDVFRVERSGTQIIYKKNGSIFYTSNQIATTQSLLGDASIVHQNAKIKNLRVTSTSLNTVLQTVDYTYNIRGWLKGINDVNNIGEDLFTFKLNYNDPTQGTALYNGNISETLWQTVNDDNAGVSSRSYFYNYDALNRITEAVFDKTGGANQDGFYNLKHVDYDKNGNIGVLRRSGVDTNNNDAFLNYMDNLTYTYTGNQLLKVAENGGHTEGFKDGTNTGDDYTYDANGNMITDANKGITTISYNHLNLPTQVTTADGTISYIYDATGIKLKKLVNETGQNTISTLYAGNYIYEDNASGVELKFFSQPEGYTEPIDANDLSLGFNYVYQYKDHLGNIRLSYSDTDKNGAIGTGEIIEENNYYPFGLKHKGYNGNVSANVNSAASKFGFGGKEHQDEMGLGWIDITARNYDAALGRWMNIDPLAEDMRRHSPYNYAFDNPISFIDPDGMAPFWINNGDGTWTAEKGDGAETLAQDAGISVDRAKEIMANTKKDNSSLGNMGTYIDPKDDIEKSAVDEGDVVTITEDQEVIASLHSEVEIEETTKLAISNTEVEIERAEHERDSLNDYADYEENHIQNATTMPADELPVDPANAGVGVNAGNARLEYSLQYKWLIPRAQAKAKQKSIDSMKALNKFRERTLKIDN